MKNLIPICMLMLLISLATFGQGNGFNFQGRLNDGTNPANGRYDLQFRLYDAITGGNQIGAVFSQPNTTLTNGVFSVTLDFGGAAFNSPNSIFIEIAIRPSGSPNAYTILGPRQQLTVVPFAVRSANATNADNAAHAVNADTAFTATIAQVANNALTLGQLPAQSFAQLNVHNTGDLQTNGALAITGNASQPIAANGFVKAMIYLNPDGTILRCYNGITNSTTGNCGFSTRRRRDGEYQVSFGFRVVDRFISATTISPSSVNIVTSVTFFGETDVLVANNITDVDWFISYADNPCMLIVY